MKLKRKFHFHRNPILIDNVDINKIIAFNKDSFSKKVLTLF